MRPIATAIVLLLLGLPVRADPPPIDGQRPIPAMAGSFQFIHGAWARYQVEQRTTGERYRLWIATLQAKPAVKQHGWWLETRVEPENGTPVVTRALVPATPDGPGEPVEVIVQVAGKRPFSVPKKYLRGENREVAPLVRIESGERQAERRIQIGDREFPALDVVAVDTQGHAVRATVSEAVPPLGLITVETAETRMELEDWGSDARTGIEGKPLSLFWWVMSEVLQGAPP